MSFTFPALSSLKARIAAAAAMTGAVFCLDVVTPLGVADWALYLIPLLLFYRISDARFLLTLSAAAIFLTIAGCLFSPGGAPFLYWIFNRIVGIFVLSVTTMILLARRRADEALRASEERYRALIETARDAIFIADAETGIILDANQNVLTTMFSEEAVGGTARRAPATPRYGSETILLAEDEEMVRMVLKEILESCGYGVIEAADGEEAVRSFRENRERIHLALIDVVMPKKSGKEVFEEIYAMMPDMKVLFMSGHTADIVTESGVIDSDHAFIPKPFEPDMLLEKIRNALDATSR